MGWFLYQTLAALEKLPEGVVSCCAPLQMTLVTCSPGFPGMLLKIQFHTPCATTSVTEAGSQPRGNVTILT